MTPSNQERAEPFVPAKQLARREWVVMLTGVGKLIARPVRQLPASAGTGVPVLLIPGFMAGDWSMIPLARYLRRAGHPTLTTGIKFNVACTEELVDRLERRLEQCVAEAGRPVALIGWSRGGSLARMLAVRRPELVAGLITLGSPLLNQLAASPAVLKQVEQLVKLNKSGKATMLSEDCVRGQCAERMNALLVEPIAEHIPFASLYSRSDGIVDWRACLDPHAELIEVSTSHNDMGDKPAVHRIIAARLAAIKPTRSAA